MILSGKKLALEIYDTLKENVDNMANIPTLGAILLGNNSSSIRYIEQKKKWASYVGINFKVEKLAENISEKELLKVIENFNSDKNISGFIVQLPLPDHIDENNIINAISPDKDVDGFHPINIGKLLIGDNSGFVSCTPAGIIELLENEDIEYKGKEIVVIGRSNIVGKPAVGLLINKGATVINCNSKTKNLEKFTKSADIVITATGKPGLLTANMVKKDSIIIDVGFTVIDGKIYGDADTQNIDKLGAKITAVPGGVGALTVAMLIKNTIKASIK